MSAEGDFAALGLDLRAKLLDLIVDGLQREDVLVDLLRKIELLLQVGDRRLHARIHHDRQILRVLLAVRGEHDLYLPGIAQGDVEAGAVFL